ncbi:MAG: LysM peptidoglycan-binding domain-containing protein [Candidatus Methylacidiphilales bacterium]|nr:LysM peptidoglycan-binding domain-containing protein [Candidatus Methylacidiphilales bacterium]
MERDLPQSQTGGLKLMTVFIVVLALHVVVIGGISAYHIMRGDDKEARDLLAQNSRENPQFDGTGTDPAAIPPAGTGDNSSNPGGSSVAFTPPSGGTLPVEPTAAPGGTMLPPIGDNGDTTGNAAVPPTIEPPASRHVNVTGAPRPIAVADSEQPIPAGLGNYTVKSGDTLQKIAQRYNMSVEDIMSINNMPQDHIRVGQKLKLTGTRVAAGTPTEPARKTDPKGKNNKVVKTDKTETDTVDSTDKTKKTTVTAKNDKTEKSDGRKHKVESGDTVFYLAKRYKTTVAAIRAANGLDDTVTKPKTGMTLKIPGGSTKDVAKNNN